MNQYAVNLQGSVVQAGKISAAQRGRYRCIACGALLLERGGASANSARAGHFMHVTKPDCKQSHQVQRFLAAAAAYSIEVNERLQVRPGFQVQNQKRVLSFDFGRDLLA